MSASRSNSLDLFHVIDEGVAILRSKGVFRQTKVYKRGEQVFAGWAGGFVRLMAYNGTSHPNVSWLGLQAKGVRVDGSSSPRFVGQED